MILIWVSILLTVGYGVLMMMYRYGWSRQSEFTARDGYVPATTISVIIAARNEEANIGQCIDHILAQQYPSHLLEVVVVDDHSTDATATIVGRYADARVKYINLTEHIDEGEAVIAYKKKAIDTGIALSTGGVIVTTDADCMAGPLWLMQVAALYELKDPVMIVAPVDLTNNNNLVEVFQSLDFMSMQGITAASHYLRMGNMSNGANLAFSRAAYEQVNGYAGIDHLASGDDYLLMMKMQKAFTRRIAYLRSLDAIVTTPPQHDWAGFYRQRVRWASKSGKYDDKKMTTILSFVYLFNFSCLILAIAAIFDGRYFTVLALCILIKTFTELIYLYPVARYFGKRRQLLVFPFLQLLHILYIVLVGFAGFAGKYHWKGRVVR